MDFLGLLFFIVAILITLAVHEASHALTAYYLGDPTAKLYGRLTLNPIKHIDPIGGMVFLVTLLIGRPIGWGKPVPVDPRNFKNPIKDNALTALAGPLSNFIFAFALAFPIKYFQGYIDGAVLDFLRVLFDINIILGIFNLFPLPPLDGSKIIGFFIPQKWHQKYENYLENGMKYSVAIILIDVFILSDLLGFTIFGFLIGNLYHYVSAALLLGT